MQLRRKILPRALADGLSVVFLLIIVPLVYWFELWIVMPSLYQNNDPIYALHFIFGNFIMINIVGNFTYTVLCDTSVNRQVLLVPQDNGKRNGWRLCSVCECLAPPRSWHCNTCDTCILKRDHHCIFSACCVGHKNQRYFIMFVLYMFVATIYAFFYNNYFIWNRIEFVFPMTLIKLVFPVAMFVFDYDGTNNQIYLMLYILIFVGMIFTGALFFYHANLVIKGCTSDENNKNNLTYNLGWRRNIVEVFGERWYLVWLLPYIESKLPQDGVTWIRSTRWNMNNSKFK